MLPAAVRKVALLLTALEPGTAGELLKSARPDTITEIAAEIAYLSQTGQAVERPGEPVREFVTLMHGGRKGGRGQFVQDLLDHAVGRARSGEIMGRIQQSLEARDPFRAIRAASVEHLARALAGESGYVAAMVLADLPPAKSTQLIPLLEEASRSDAVRGLTEGQQVPVEARLKVAMALRSRLEEYARPGQVVRTVSTAQKREQLRKVAVLLRGLAKPLRDNLLESIRKQNAQTGDEVRKLMIVWEDVPLAPDKAMQGVLRTVDARKLALALTGAAGGVAEKVRGNISERARAMLEEEASLLSKPAPDDIAAAREAILDALRELNAKGELTLEAA